MPKPTPVRLGPVLLRPMAIKGDHARWRAEWYPPGSNGKMRTRSLSRKRGERISEDEAVGRAIELMAAGEHLVSVDADGTPSTRVETVLDLLEVWLGAQQERVGTDIRASTFESYKVRCRVLAKDAIADVRLNGVGAQDLPVMARRLTGKYEGRTVETIFMVLRAAWRWGLEQSPPLVPGPLPSFRLKGDRRPQHMPTDADVQATLDALATLQATRRFRCGGGPDRLPQSRVALEILWGTGARPRELAMSGAEAFDLRTGVWLVPGGLGSKTGRRSVPLSDAVRQLVADHLAGRTDGPLFPPPDPRMGQRWGHWAAKGAKHAGVARWTPKGLRHLAITNMLASGVEVQTVAAIVGNSPETIWRTYAHVLHGRPEQSVAFIGRTAAGNVVPFRRRG